ncbi:uncharacterized protein LOC133785297 [Humulus lupulus]|uniref:uncharacterized protein LOC133785297 n=1 Tax=Humulus lupulus TaxID=3486 RepID=UPI002B4009D1|nr:uncharacterized protein LOC133785297 [Humulus lupulus]
MHEEDCIHTTFTTEMRLYFYKVMPFGLKNANATYQRMMNKIFVNHLGSVMEIYINDMVEKSKHPSRHIPDLTECFPILDHFQMNLNLAKCVIGVSACKFWGNVVSIRGIEANPTQIASFSEVQGDENNCVFYDFKTYSSNPPILSSLISNEELFLYLAMSSATHDGKGDPSFEAIHKFESDESEWVWILSTDGASNVEGSGIGVVLEAPSGLKMEEALQFNYQATNNEPEYEALLYSCHHLFHCNAYHSLDQLFSN